MSLNMFQFDFFSNTWPMESSSNLRTSWKEHPEVRQNKQNLQYNYYKTCSTT